MCIDGLLKSLNLTDGGSDRNPLRSSTVETSGKYFLIIDPHVQNAINHREFLKKSSPDNYTDGTPGGPEFNEFRYTSIAKRTQILVENHNGNKLPLMANEINFTGTHDICVIISRHPQAGYVGQYIRALAKDGGVIIDLTSEEDKKKRHLPDYASEKKRYEDGTEIQPGQAYPSEIEGFYVNHNGEKIEHDFEILIREMKILNKETSINVKHLHYKNWPDGSAIYHKTMLKMMFFEDEAGLLKDGFLGGGHCAAGVGRSPQYFISKAIYYFIKQSLKSGKGINKKLILNMASSMIKDMQEQRSLQFPQIDAQASEIYHFSLHALKKLSAKYKNKNFSA